MSWVRGVFQPARIGLTCCYCCCCCTCCCISLLSAVKTFSLAVQGPRWSALQAIQMALYLTDPSRLSGVPAVGSRSTVGT